MLKLLVAAALTYGFTAHAELGVGAVASYHLSDSYTADTPGESITGKSSYAIGGLLYLPLIPDLSARIGVEYEKLGISDTYSAGATHVTWENLLIPLDLQFDLPVTNLYVFGGLIFAENYNRPRLEPGWTDLRFNLGAGYNIIDLGPAKLSGELEYMKGTQNLSPVPGNSLKTSAFAVNVQVRFTL